MGKTGQTAMPGALAVPAGTPLAGLPMICRRRGHDDAPPVFQARHLLGLRAALFLKAFMPAATSLRALFDGTGSNPHLRQARRASRKWRLAQIVPPGQRQAGRVKCQIDF